MGRGVYIFVLLSSEGGSHFDYFTQLIWANTSEVGCGGVKFKERFIDQDMGRNRTVYRLVCNFAPSGNVENQSAYTHGPPCSKCPEGTTCDAIYGALCSNLITHQVQKDIPTKTKEILNSTTSFLTDAFVEIMKSTVTPTNEVKSYITDTVEDNYTPFDYFSHLHDFTRQFITTTTAKTECKDVLAVDDFIDLLRKKLSSDPMLKEMLLATKPSHGCSDSPFTDASVAALVNKIYSKKEPPTIKIHTESDVLNSTLLVDLIEAVIFRSGENVPANANLEQTTQSMSPVNPVKIQAELGQIQENVDFTGHYFFPEDEEEGSVSETTESYYDGSNLSIPDVIMEIEDIRKNTITKNFLDEILESESSTESTTIVTLLSPDDMNAHKSGHEIMKKFLEDIKDKASSQKELT